MERAEQLGRLSAEEMAKKREDEWRERGKAVAARHIQGAPLRDLTTELRQIADAKERAATQQGAIAELLSAISLEPSPAVAAALEGIAAVAESPQAADLTEAVAAVQRAFRQETDKRSQVLHRDLGAQVLADLGDQGIAGSAVRVNVQAAEEWRQEEEAIRATYTAKLEEKVEAIRGDLG